MFGIRYYFLSFKFIFEYFSLKLCWLSFKGIFFLFLERYSINDYEY